MIDVGSETCYFACDECGICEQLGRRLRCAEETGTELQFDHCSCDKIDNEFFIGGYCEDAFVDKHLPRRKGRRKTGRAFRREMKTKKLNRLLGIISDCDPMMLSYGIDKTGLPCANWYNLWRYGIDENGIRKTYIRKSRPSKYKEFYKNYSNRVIRRSGTIPKKGNQHHKMFKYWWKIAID